MGGNPIKLSSTKKCQQNTLKHHKWLSFPIPMSVLHLELVFSVHCSCCWALQAKQLWDCSALTWSKPIKYSTGGQHWIHNVPPCSWSLQARAVPFSPVTALYAVHSHLCPVEQKRPSSTILHWLCSPFLIPRLSHRHHIYHQLLLHTPLISNK